MSVRVALHDGATIQGEDGRPLLVVGVRPLSVRVETIHGEVLDIRFEDLEVAVGMLDGRVDAVAGPFRHKFESVREAARQLALDREEIVLTVETGFARGHRALAREGEPFWPFDPADGISLARKLSAMVEQLAAEDDLDRQARRDREAGRSTRPGRIGSPTANAIRNWHRDYFGEPGGLFELVDGRSRKGRSQFDSLDEEIKDVCKGVVGRFDGTESAKRQKDIYRQVLSKLSADGFVMEELPRDTLRRYIAHVVKPLGRTTRAHKTNKLRTTASYSSFATVGVGQVVAIDVTRADNFCFDPFTGSAVSVEVMTAIDLASRVIVGTRVFPRSPTGFEAGLLLVDVLRPYSLAVDPTRVDDWRWAGVPEHIGLFPHALAEAERIDGLAGRPLVGEHGIPGVLPDAIRADRGSIFTGTHFRALCRQFGINLLLSRGAHPTDNAVMERFWETLQACFQAAPGYKGHNVSERGSKVGRITLDKAGQPVFHGGAPALTPRELERHIREWIATTYHRSPHSSLVLADESITAEDARMRLTPLDVYDSLMAAQGRIHVLQRADLIYDAMPIRWGQIGANGVEFDDLYYDCRELDEFRNVRDWTFRSPDQPGHTGDQRARAGAKAAPFYYDPRDVSAYWLRHPDTDRIVRVPWRREHELRAPMTGVTLRHAKGLIKKRGAYRDLSRDSIEEEVLTTLNTADGYDRLRGDPDLADWHGNMLTAAAMRSGQSKHDHGEAASAAGGRTPSTGGAPRPRSRPEPPAKTTRAPWETDAADWSNLEEQE